MFLHVPCGAPVVAAADDTFLFCRCAITELFPDPSSPFKYGGGDRNRNRKRRRKKRRTYD